MRSLFIGNIGNAEREIIKYFDEQFGKKSNDIYKKNKLDYKKLFYSKEYDNVFYFSSGFDESIDDLNNFLRILDSSNGVRKYVFIVKGSKFGLDKDNENIEVIKDIFAGYQIKKNKNIIFLNMSCLYGKDFIDGEINEVSDGGKYKNVIGNYVHVNDFAKFLYLLAFHKFDMDYVELQADVSVKIKDLLSTKNSLETIAETSEIPLNYKFEHSIINDVKNGVNIRNLLKRKIKDRGRHPILKVLEIVVMFAASEFFINVFNTTFNIQYIDFRLIFMTVVAIYYELGYSLFATGLVILSFLFINIDSSYDLSVILTNTDNWVAIIIYLVMTIVIRSKIKRYENRIKSADERIVLLESQNKQKQRNLNKYESKIKDLNRAIITQDNSLAKVANFIISCRVINDESIYEMFADNLGTENIVVLRVKRNRFSMAYTRSDIDYSYLADEKVSNFIKNNSVWVNSDLNQELPLYMVPICDVNGLCYVVTVWDYDAGIMNNDYRNNLLSLASIVSFLKESEK